MIAKGVDLIAVTGTANAVAAREASKSIPIVALACGYPVESGLAASLARPGGNMTGPDRMNPDMPSLEHTLAEADTASLDAVFVSAGGAQSAADGIAKVAAFCERRRLPTMCDVAGKFFAAGGVLSYSVEWRELGVRSAGHVDRILRGAKPGDLPIEQPTRFELVLNLNRAQLIGMAIPPAILARADRVIQ